MDKGEEGCPGPTRGSRPGCPVTEVYHSPRVGLSKVYCPTKHIIGHIRDRFLRVERPNQHCRTIRLQSHQVYHTVLQ